MVDDADDNNDDDDDVNDDVSPGPTLLWTLLSVVSKCPVSAHIVTVLTLSAGLFKHHDSHISRYTDIIQIHQNIAVNHYQSMTMIIKVI